MITDERYDEPIKMTFTIDINKFNYSEAKQFNKFIKKHEDKIEGLDEFDKYWINWLPINIYRALIIEQKNRNLPRLTDLNMTRAKEKRHLNSLKANY